MFNSIEYSQKVQKRISQLNERFADLESNKQLIEHEMRFIELEMAGLNGQALILTLVNENTSNKNLDTQNTIQE